jgi:hypothetical protein
LLCKFAGHFLSRSVTFASLITSLARPHALISRGPSRFAPHTRVYRLTRCVPHFLAHLCFYAPYLLSHQCLVLISSPVVPLSAYKLLILLARTPRSLSIVGPRGWPAPLEANAAPALPKRTVRSHATSPLLTSGRRGLVTLGSSRVILGSAPFLSQATVTGWQAPHFLA